MGPPGLLREYFEKVYESPIPFGQCRIVKKRPKDHFNSISVCFWTKTKMIGYSCHFHKGISEIL